MTEPTDRDAILEAERKAIKADPAYSIPSSRLAGSPGCLNCGTPLQGPFCYHCGQPDRNFMRFFPALLRELMTDFLELDSRFMRTLKPLLFKPGRLTRDYLEGRRFRYTPPLRLYLFSSILFFLLAAFLSSGAITTTGSARSTEGLVQIAVDTPEERDEIEKTLSQLPGPIRDQINLSLKSELEAEEDEFFDSQGFNIDGEPWDRETNPVDIAWLPGWVNDSINDEIEESPEKAKQINENPDLIVDKVFDILPGTMFVLLPVVALIFKFWYLFAKRYYIEHLILALHNHAFIFVLLIFALLLEVAENAFNARGWDLAMQATVWANLAVAIWIPVYLLVSLRTVYRQNWFLTVIKGFLIGISYLTLLGFVSGMVALLSFILL